MRESYSKSVNRRVAAALTALSLVAALSALDQTVVSTALPHIVDSVQGASLLGWVFSAYFLGATATVPVIGSVSDQFGRRRVFLVSIVLFGLGSLACGAANSMPLLVLFRGVQGIGAGAIQTCALIVMADMFPPRQRAKWQVINSIGFATGSAIGPTLGGILSDAVSWRWIFLLNGPLCVLTIAALLYGLPRVSRASSRPRIDWYGSAFSGIALITLLLALTWGGHDYAWVSPEIGLLLIASAVAGGLLVWVERHAAQPVIPGSLLRGNVRALSSLAGAGNSVVWFSLILLVPLRLQLVLGSSATLAGALLTPGIVLGPTTSFIAGLILSRTGRYRFTSIGAGVFQLLGVGLFVLLPPTADQLWITVSYMIACVGTGFGGPTFMVVYQNVIPTKQLGAGIGMFSLFRQFGASAGTALAGSIVGAEAASANPELLGQAVQRAALMPLVGAVVVIVSAFFMLDRPLRSSLHEVEETRLAGV
ncbi:MAG TPA: MFS transporter [Chloroflexota bacterium]|nr:MFS transporter [Chloroflexota bacterium]